MRKSWTDDRLDDFRGEVKERFELVDKRFDGVDKRFDRVEGQINLQALEMRRGFEAMAKSLERTHHLMVQSAVGMAAAFAAIIAGLLGLIATQL